MTSVYLHIGTVKTGTSSLQSFLLNNRAVLEKKGYGLPEIDLGLGANFLPRNGHFLIYKTGAKLDDKYEKRLDKAFAIIKSEAEKYENLILTEEEVWHCCRDIPDFWENLERRFREINCRIKVVVYLRRQDELAESLWNQWVKSYRMETRSFARWIEDKEYEYYQMDYYTHLNRIAEIVGKENMIVRVYQKDVFMKKNDALFEDFLRAVGLSLTREFGKRNVSRNHGLHGNFTEFRRMANQLPEYHNQDEFFRRAFMLASLYADQIDPPAKTGMFSYEERMSFLKQFEESNRKTALEYAGKENGVLFEEEVTDIPRWKWDSDRAMRDMYFVLIEAMCSQNLVVQKQSEQIRALETQIRKMNSLEPQITSMYRSPIFRAYRKIRKAIKGE